MFVDKAKIYIKSGDGGDGCVSLHREKYVSAGGPDGGDGGRGGDIVFFAEGNVRTLLDFKYQTKYISKNGERGGKNNMSGKKGDTLFIGVPAGTVIKDFETGKVVADIRQGVKRLALKGGSGGKGNSRFKSATRQTPRFATPGRRTKGRWVTLELKTIADVGLIGFPNVGKSTLLSVVTSANPKIANYHFTTLSPNLGVYKWNDTSFVMADIPGLIEGASEGIGLGHEFLRHIERTRLLVHILDGSESEGRDVYKDYHDIRNELKNYSNELYLRPEIVVLNKADINSDTASGTKLKKGLEKKGVKVFTISAVVRTGLTELMHAVSEELLKLPEPEPIYEEGVIENWELEAEKTFEIKKDNDLYIVSGDLIDEILFKINPEDYSSMQHFQKLLMDFNIINGLKEAGAKTGDSVVLNDVEFDFVE
jgi:GTPase